MPEYTPDFIKLAESYGAKRYPGYKKKKILNQHSEEAKKRQKSRHMIEFDIDPEEMVYPMVKPNGTLEDLIMDC